MLVRFPRSPATLDLATDPGPLATVHNRWPDLLSECEKRLPEVTSPEKRADMLVAMGGLVPEGSGGCGGGRKGTGGGHGGQSPQPAGFRALVELHSQRGNWLRAAASSDLRFGQGRGPGRGDRVSLEAPRISHSSETPYLSCPSPRT